jgi:hypothetical protein
MDKFFYDYNFSKFIECNQVLANSIAKKYNASMSSNLIRKSTIAPCLLELTNFLENLKKRYWLTSGGLLGWYRECNFVPYSLGINFLHLFFTPTLLHKNLLDLDISMDISDYDINMKKLLLRQIPVYLHLQLGRPQTSLEFILHGCGFTYDIIFLHKVKNVGYCNHIHSESIEP